MYWFVRWDLVSRGFTYLRVRVARAIGASHPFPTESRASLGLVLQVKAKRGGNGSADQRQGRETWPELSREDIKGVGDGEGD